MSRSREVVADPKARHRIDRLTEMEQRCLLRIRGRQENSGNLLGVRWSPDGAVEEHGTEEQGNTG